MGYFPDLALSLLVPSGQRERLFRKSPGNQGHSLSVYADRKQTFAPGALHIGDSVKAAASRPPQPTARDTSYFCACCGSAGKPLWKGQRKKTASSCEALHTDCSEGHFYFYSALKQNPPENRGETLSALVFPCGGGARSKAARVWGVCPTGKLQSSAAMPRGASPLTS